MIKQNIPYLPKWDIFAVFGGKSGDSFSSSQSFPIRSLSVKRLCSYQKQYDRNQTVSGNGSHKQKNGTHKFKHGKDKLSHGPNICIGKHFGVPVYSITVWPKLMYVLNKVIFNPPNPQPQPPAPCFDQFTCFCPPHSGLSILLPPQKGQHQSSQILQQWKIMIGSSEVAWNNDLTMY